MRRPSRLRHALHVCMLRQVQGETASVHRHRDNDSKCHALSVYNLQFVRSIYMCLNGVVCIASFRFQENHQVIVWLVKLGTPRSYIAKALAQRSWGPWCQKICNGWLCQEIGAAAAAIWNTWMTNGLRSMQWMAMAFEVRMSSKSEVLSEIFEMFGSQSEWPMFFTTPPTREDIVFLGMNMACQSKFWEMLRIMWAQLQALPHHGFRADAWQLA